MLAWEIARQWQSANCMTPFEELLGWHLSCGLVHSTPSVFLLAQEVNWNLDSKEIVEGQKPNAWFVELAAATCHNPMKEFLRVATRPHKFVLWCRQSRGRKHDVHAYRWEHLARRVGYSFRNFNPSLQIPKPMGGSAPSAPAPINQADVYANAAKYGTQSYKDQLAAQIAAYPKLEALQLGSVNKLSANLNDAYTGQAKGVIDQTLQQGATSLTDTGNRINQLGGLNMGLAQTAYQQAQGPTELDRQIASQGANAANVRPDQVSMPEQMRSVDPLYAQARFTGMGQLGGSLMEAAQSRLANNGQLSAEELRNAGQQAAASYAARGLATGSGAAAAEILNRAAYSRQRLNEDSAFAQNVNAQDLARRETNTAAQNQFSLSNQGVGMQAQLANQSMDQTMNAQRLQAQQANQAANMNQTEANRQFLLNSNQNLINSNITRGNYAGSMLGNTANLYGQAGGAYQNAAGLGFQGANALVNLDPYQRALGTGVQLGSGIQGQSGQMIGNAYGAALDMGGNIASTNYNAQWSARNAALNNNSALLGAGIGAIGSIGGAAAGGYMMGAGMGAVAL
jgi:hypothetical protein